MQEKTLTKIALITTLVGLVALYLLSSLTQIPIVPVEELEWQPDDRSVKIQGVVQKSTDMEKVSFLTIAQENVDTATVVLFKDHELDISEGSYVEIEGTIEEYEGKKEIIANKIEVR